jgi:hypothetical protein
MPNTIDAALIGSTISEQAQTVLGNRLAALSLFSSDFSAEVKKPKDTIQVPIATATASTQTNPTSFNSTGGTTLDKATVALDHIYQPFGLDYSDIQNAIKLEKLVKINLNALADRIWALVTAPITVANYGAAVVAPATAAANFAAGDLAKLWASVSKSGSKGLVLSPTLYSGIIPTQTIGLTLDKGAYGFDSGIYYANQFSGQTRLAGFACSPEALAIAAAAPSLDHVRSNMLISDVVVLEQLGMSIYYNVWADPASRAIVASAEVMFGAAKAVTSGTMGLIVAAA